MSRPKELPLSSIQFYSTAPYPCSYLPGETARSQVATPSHQINADTYSELIKRGFRRSGFFTYKPHCDQCNQCKPYRVIAADYKPNRSQRRAKKAWWHLKARVQQLHFNPEHFSLYQCYQTSRHEGGGMDEDSREQYDEFLLQSNANSRLIEFRGEQNTLYMVSMVDILADGLSSVYTFFDPEAEGGLGTYGVIWQLEQCNDMNLPYLYLGYWIEASPKMAYKTHFKPGQILQNNDWVNAVHL